MGSEQEESASKIATTTQRLLQGKYSVKTLQRFQNKGRLTMAEALNPKEWDELVTGLKKLQQDSTDLSKNIMGWFDHTDHTIEIDGINVPLSFLFDSSLKTLSTVSDSNVYNYS